MQFSSLGTIQSHVKSMELQMKWQEKKKNPGMLTAKESVPATQTQANGKYNAFAIEMKLKAGQQLTSDEMNYLRGNYPDLYSQAVDAENARRSYKSSLDNCRTKDDVTRANMSRIAALHGEITAVQNDPNIGGGEKFKLSVGIHMKAQAVSDEHVKFQSSGEYHKLPTEQELRDKEKAENREKEKELEKAEPKETEQTEETPQTEEQGNEAAQPQSGKDETGDIEAHSASKPEAPKPAPEPATPHPTAPESATTQPAPEAAAMPPAPEPGIPGNAAPQPSSTPANGSASPHNLYNYGRKVAVKGISVNLGV